MLSQPALSASPHGNFGDPESARCATRWPGWSDKSQQVVPAPIAVLHELPGDQLIHDLVWPAREHCRLEGVQ